MRDKYIVNPIGMRGIKLVPMTRHRRNPEMVGSLKQGFTTDVFSQANWTRVIYAGAGVAGTLALGYVVNKFAGKFLGGDTATTSGKAKSILGTLIAAGLANGIWRMTIKKDQLAFVTGSAAVVAYKGIKAFVGGGTLFADPILDMPAGKGILPAMPLPLAMPASSAAGGTTGLGRGIGQYASYGGANYQGQALSTTNAGHKLTQV